MRLTIWYEEEDETREPFKAFVHYAWTQQREPRPLEPNVWGSDLDWSGNGRDEFRQDLKPPVPDFGNLLEPLLHH